MTAAGVLLATGACAGGQPPAQHPAEAVVVPASTAANAQALPVGSAAHDEPAPASPPAPSVGEPITGIQECDAYLDAYKRCEKRMEAEIAAGNAIRYKNEAARLKYLQSTPEAPGLPQACVSWLQGLRGKCGP